MSILKFEFTYDTSSEEFSVVNTSTGEIKTVSTKKKIKTNKIEESSIPQLTLEDNKYSLNTAAVNLLQVQAGDKIDIKYQKVNGKIQPVIATDEVFGTKGGNVLSKSNTVACRGNKQNELSKYGRQFTLTPHESGMFILTGDGTVEELKGDDNVAVEDEDLSLDLADIIDGKDADITEIDSSLFTF